MSIADYAPHGMVAALSTIIGYVFQRHVKTDDDRFKELTKAIGKLGEKIDEVGQAAAERHNDLVNTLLAKRG